MAGTRYGTVPYGTAYYGGDNVLVAAPGSAFRATPADYGTARLTWTRSAGTWTRQRVVRSVVGPPVDELDGEVVLEQPTATASTSHLDSGLVGGTAYYYGLFVLEVGSSSWRRTGVADLVGTQDFGYAARMYSRLPQVFKGSDPAILTPVDDEDTLLYRFLEAFGFQLDHVRTELEGLRRANDARLVSGRLLPALSHQVGVRYEPELGDRGVRRLTAAATHLWGVKGSLAGARELASTFTGWRCDVRLGRNLALDRLSAGPDGDTGRWTGRTGCTTAYAAFTEENAGPAGQGALLVVSTASAASMVYDENPAGATPLERLQYAVPVLPGQSYVVSQYQRTAAPGLSGAAGISFLDAVGEPVGVTSWGPADPLDDTWTNRPAHVAVAPPTARYLEHRFRVSGTLNQGTTVRACGLMVQEDLTLRPWEPAREVVVYLGGDLQNYVGNPSGHGLSAEGWTGAGANEQGLTYDTSFLLVNTTTDLRDALVVDVPGDVAPEEPAPPTELTLQATYDAVRRVQERQTWSVLVDAVGTFGEQERAVRVGFALYDGDTLVGYDWAEPAAVALDEQTLGHELTVPDGAPYDRVAFAIQSDNPAVTWRRAALELAKLPDARQFDGATPSSTGDYFWQGVPHRSTSHYYHRRAAKAARLRELLEDFLPHPASFRLAFAQEDIPDSPRSSAGTDLDPDDDPTTTVSARLRMRWTTATRVGAELGLQWEVQNREVSRELGLRWHTESLHKTLGIAWDTQSHYAPVGAELELQWVTAETLVLGESIVVEE